MHDFGPLVEPKEGNGPIPRILAAIQLAKTHNDAYLTRVMEEECLLAAKQGPAEKKAKVHHDDK